MCHAKGANYPGKKFKVVFNAAVSGDQPETIVDIFDEISDWWGWGLNRLAYALHGVSGPIRVRVNSYGGDLLQGLAIMNFLRDYAGEVTVEVLGVAASAATFIVAGGDKVRMREGSFLMIHNPFMLAVGGAEELDSAAISLRKMEDEMIEVYLSDIRKRGKFEKETDDSLRAKIRGWMDAETWFTSSEAVEVGLADEVVAATMTEASQAIEEAAAYSPESFQNFRNTPERVLNLISANKKNTDQMPTENKTTDKKKKSLWARLENFLNSLETEEVVTDETEEVVTDTPDLETARQTLEDAGYVVTEANAEGDNEEESEESAENEEDESEETTEVANKFTQEDIDNAVKKALADAGRKKAAANPGGPAASDSKKETRIDAIRKRQLRCLMIWPI